MNKVLQVTGGMRIGGAETMLMNIYRNIDREKVQFDFLLYEKMDTPYTREIEKMGGKILVLNKKYRWDIYSYRKKFFKIINENGPYNVIHAHTGFNSGIPLMIANEVGIPIRICHSHFTKDGKNESIGRDMYHLLMRYIINNNANVLLACGQAAGTAMYGTKAYQSRCEILHNAIDTSLFLKELPKELIYKYKKEFNINDDELVIGSIANFREAKNHIFMVNIAQLMKEKDIKFKMLFIGDGESINNIKEIVNDKGLENDIIFLGSRTDVHQIIHVFDVLLMPSLYEGFPVTLIESQTAGVPAVISKNISNEVDLGLNLIHRVDLNDNRLKWIKILISCGKTKNTKQVQRENKLKEMGFDIYSSISKIYELYGIKI